MSTASVALYASTIASSQLLGAKPEEADDKKHHLQNSKGFQNPWDSYISRAGPTIAWMMIKRLITGQLKQPSTAPPTVPVIEPHFLPTRETPELRATWLGHACFYVEFPGGLRVLFDPVFEHRCSPFSFLGPQRFTKPPCEVEDIPIIDAVVISHSHYDHLSHPSILKIKAKHPNVQFFAPLGNKAWFTKCGISSVTELDWWEQKELKLSKVDAKDAAGVAKVDDVGDNSPAEITAVIGCTPCQHTAARTPFDKDTTLWASWVVESGGKKVFFGGDTGYRSVPELDESVDDYGEEFKHLPHCPAFADIGKYRGPFDLGLLPIGAYKPRVIMSPMHADPFDSVNIFVDTKCKRALGMHWGTWVLTTEEVLEPPKLLKQALKQKGLEEDVFDVCDIGESREYSSKL